VQTCISPSDLDFLAEASITPDDGFFSEENVLRKERPPPWNLNPLV